MDTDTTPDLESRTALDNHANMPVVGAGAFVIAELGRTCNISPYCPYYSPTKKGGKSSCGHTCCQLFMSDKGFVYVVPMRWKGEVLQAMKQFAKEIGAPDAFVANMSGEQMSKEVKAFAMT